jgi:hypothetical protein
MLNVIKIISRRHFQNSGGKSKRYGFRIFSDSNSGK